MKIRVEFTAGVSFSDACREAQSLMAVLPMVTAVSFSANLIECTVYPHTDPEEFEMKVDYAQGAGKTYVIDTSVY